MTKRSFQASRAANGSEAWQRLYFDHPYLTRFTAQVVERPEQAGRPAVVLDQTPSIPPAAASPTTPVCSKPWTPTTARPRG